MSQTIDGDDLIIGFSDEEEKDIDSDKDESDTTLLEEKSEETENKSEKVIEDIQEDSKENEHSNNQPVISRAYRENKFKSEGASIIYESKPLEIMKNFIKSYRYIFNLLSSIEKNDMKYREINDYVLKYRNLYSILIHLQVMYESKQNLGKSRIMNQIIIVIRENIDKINLLVDYVYPLGKVVKLYDPDEVIGYY